MHSYALCVSRSIILPFDYTPTNIQQQVNILVFILNITRTHLNNTVDSFTEMNKSAIIHSFTHTHTHILSPEEDSFWNETGHDIWD